MVTVAEVPESGIAGLLKRVLGDRIEQRRKAVRVALKALAAGDRPSSGELLSAEPAFTPTGNDRITVTGASAVTGTGLSGVGPPSGPISRPMRTPPPPDLASRVALAGYIIGAAGLAIALIVIVMMSR